MWYSEHPLQQPDLKVFPLIPFPQIIFDIHSLYISKLKALKKLS